MHYFGFCHLQYFVELGMVKELVFLSTSFAAGLSYSDKAGIQVTRLSNERAAEQQVDCTSCHTSERTQHAPCQQYHAQAVPHVQPEASLPFPSSGDALAVFEADGFEAVSYPAQHVDPAEQAVVDEEMEEIEDYDVMPNDDDDVGDTDSSAEDQVSEEFLGSNAAHSIVSACWILQSISQ